VQCPEVYLFCMECAHRTAEEAIGHRNVVCQCDYLVLVSGLIFTLGSRIFSVWTKAVVKRHDVTAVILC
jgi:hypothetical protein